LQSCSRPKLLQLDDKSQLQARGTEYDRSSAASYFAITFSLFFHLQFFMAYVWIRGGFGAVGKNNSISEDSGEIGIRPSKSQ
jgi:hypothetical protein